MTVAHAPPVARPAVGPADDPSTADGRRVDGRVVAGIAALVAVAVALRLEGVATWYWIDEALSVGIARHDLLDIPGLLLRDGSPPLWYLLLHGWTSLLGTSATATHVLSLVFGVVVVPVAWLVARRLFDHRSAWLTAGLAAISPFVTYFSRETRMYSLVVVLAVMVSGSFVAAFIDGRSRARWWFAASLAALLYTHNWGIYTGLACALALLPALWFRTDRDRFVRDAAVAFGLVALVYLPWVPSLASQVENTGAPWSYTPSFRDVVRELAALFRDERVLVGLALATGVGLGPLVRRPMSRESVVVLTLGVLAVVPVLVGWGLAHVEPSWATRYLAVVVGPLLLLIGFGLGRAGALGVASLAVAAVLIVQPITRLDGFPLPRDAKSNAHGAAVRLAPRLQPGDLVLVIQPEAVPLLHSVLGPTFRYADPSGLVEDPSVMDWRDAEGRLRSSSYDEDLAGLVASLEPGQRIALVGPGNAPSRTDTDWITLFRTAGRRVGQALRADEHLALIDRVQGRGSYVTIDAIVYERVTSSAR